VDCAALRWFQGQVDTLVLGFRLQDGEWGGGFPLVPVRAQIDGCAEDVLGAVAGAGVEDVENVVAEKESGVALVAVKEDGAGLEVGAAVAAAEEDAGHGEGVVPACGGVGIAEDPEVAGAEDFGVGSKVEAVLGDCEQGTLAFEKGIFLLKRVGFELFAPH